MTDGIKPIITSEGVTQGDTLGSWLYCVGTLPFDIGIKRVLGELHLLLCYIDDKNIQADFEAMVAAIHFIREEGPKYGYHLNMKKGRYLLGRTGSYEVSLHRKKTLVDLGLSESIIQIHPDDMPYDQRQDAELAYGVKMLGSWIGHQSYIQSQLQQKLIELEVEKNHIINFPDPQIRNLMFRWCFCQKIDYLQRTTSPAFIEDFVLEFDCMKKDIFCSLLNNIYTRDTLPESLWNRALLHIGDGGLGFRNTHDVTWSAYAASFFECAPTMSKFFPGLCDEMDSIHLNQDDHIPALNDFKACLNFITRVTGVEASVAWIHELKKSLYSLSSEEYLYGKSTQSLIGKGMRRVRLDEYKQQITDNHDLAWFVSCCDRDAGRWLEMSPKSPYTTLSANEFTSQFFYRLRLPSPFIVSGTKCTCAGFPMVDTQGIHLTTGCGKDGFRHKTHDNLVRTLESMSRCCGFVVRREEQQCFQDAFPDSQRRPDLSILNAPGRQQKVVADLMVTGPVGRQQLSRAQAVQECRAANKAYSDKCRSYGELARANNLEFVALIFESTGKIHPNTVRFIDDMLKYCAGLDKSRLGRLKRFWYTAISFSLQKHLAQSLLTRAKNLNGRPSFRYELQEQFIERAVFESEHHGRED